jgi:hypothetical protein
MRAGCKLEECQHSHGSFSGLVDHDWEFCQGINEYLSCLHKTRRSCKGNINYHVIHKGLSTLYDKRGCLSVLQGPPPATSPRPLEFPGRPEHDAETSTETTAPQQPLNCNYQPADMRHCGLFGDPHLKTFEGHFQTCRVQGAWPLIDSRYLAVQVTNEPVRPGSDATVTTKVSSSLEVENSTNSCSIVVSQIFQSFNCKTGNISFNQKFTYEVNNEP